MEEVTFIYFPDKLPSQRQMCYQLCDIMDQEAQRLIHSNDGKETVCTVSIFHIVRQLWQKYTLMRTIILISHYLHCQRCILMYGLALTMCYLLYLYTGTNSYVQEVNGWCEENTYDKLRKLLTSRMRSIAGRNVSDE